MYLSRYQFLSLVTSRLCTHTQHISRQDCHHQFHMDLLRRHLRSGRGVSLRRIILQARALLHPRNPERQYAPPTPPRLRKHRTRPARDALVPKKLHGTGDPRPASPLQLQRPGLRTLGAGGAGKRQRGLAAGLRRHPASVCDGGGSVDPCPFQNDSTAAAFSRSDTQAADAGPLPSLSWPFGNRFAESRVRSPQFLVVTV